MRKLDVLIENLKKANRRLKEALNARPTRMNKDATLQRFEFTFELAWKTLQAYIRDQGFDCKSPKNCIREAGRLEIIENVERWFKFLDKRNLITHTYNEKIADRIYRQALKFPQEIDNLLKKIS
jgi:nucleotidyltransferase substrate binding protein (TIGR01987 family)